MVAKEGIIHPFSFFSGAQRTKLFLRRVGTQQPALQTEKFEYEVLEADRVVGHIHFSDVGRKWFWEISGFDCRGKYLQKGSAESLHDAKMAIAHILERKTGLAHSN
jgi:hypothetical protein